MPGIILLTSLLIAADYPIPEVCLYFANKLLRGCRSVKVSANSLDAFASPNLPALGAAGVEINIDWGRVSAGAAGWDALTIQHLKRSYVGALRLFPGISARVLHNILQPSLQGLVLEAYGVGNGPDRDARAPGRPAAKRRNVASLSSIARSACRGALISMIMPPARR